MTHRIDGPRFEAAAERSGKVFDPQGPVSGPSNHRRPRARVR